MQYVLTIENGGEVKAMLRKRRRLLQAESFMEVPSAGKFDIEKYNREIPDLMQVADVIAKQSKSIASLPDPRLGKTGHVQ